MRRVTFLLAIILVGVAMAKRDTLLTQSFDSAWTPGTLPPGWRASGDTTPGVNDNWHRKTGYPWTADTTPYAAIYLQDPVDRTDTLFAPPLDCSFHRNIDLRCSTYFRPNGAQPYTAQIIVSTDSGGTWRVVRDYFADSVGPVLELLDVDSVGMHKDVWLAWVWSGNLVNINWWCIDNVTVLGTQVYPIDLACTKIISPHRRELPGDLTPTCQFKNRGLVPLETIPVFCDIYEFGALQIHETGPTIDSLGRGDTADVAFPTYTFQADSIYTVVLYDAFPADQDYSNDTLSITFTPSETDYVYFDNDTNAGSNSWPVGGNSGWGLRVNPLTRAQILDGEFKLHVPDSLYSGYKLRFVDSDGDSTGAPGTVIYESPVIRGAEGWNIDSLAAQQLFVSRPFYIFYIQVGNPPECPELFHDSFQSSGNHYWALNNGSYYRDTVAPVKGDWMIRCLLDYLTSVPPGVDARTVFVAQPDTAVVPRPLGIAFVPSARIENHGTTPLSDIPVECTVYTVTPGVSWTSSAVVPGPLNKDEGAIVTFALWPPVPGQCSVVVRTDYPGDEDPSNDRAVKGVYVYKPMYKAGPDGPDVRDRYFWVDSDTEPGAVGPVFNWVDTANCYNAITADAEIVQGLPIPFLFNYRGTDYSTCRISNNGWLSFDPQGSSYPNNESVPNPASPNNALYVFWDKLRAGALPNGASRVCYKTDSAPPYQRFTVIWENMRFTDAPGDTHLVTFEVTLFQSSNIVKFQYLDVTGPLSSHNNGGSATVGIENGDGTVGLNYLDGDLGTTGLYPNNELLSGRAIMFYQERRDVSADSILAPPRFGPPGQVAPVARIVNHGSQTQPFYTYCWIRTTGGTIVFYDSVFTAYMPILAETTVTFGQWNAAFGSYTIKCSTALGGDIDSSNNACMAKVTIQPWLPMASVPAGLYNRRVKAGALTSDGQSVYAFKGSNTNEFWRYDIAGNYWETLPSLPLGPRNRRCKDGCCLAAGQNYVYAVKGGNTREFYAYNTLDTAWEARESIPWSEQGASKGCRNGTQIVFATPPSGGSALYLLRGNNTPDFERYRPDIRKWDSLPMDPDTFSYGSSPHLAPMNIRTGASLAYQPGDSFIWLVAGGNSLAFLRYTIRPTGNIPRDTWVRRSQVPPGFSGRKVKAGACAAEVNDTVFLLKGGNTLEFDAYDTKTDTNTSWHGRSPIPNGVTGKRMKSGGAMTVGNGMIYVIKGANTAEFWAYGPGYDTGGFYTQPAPGFAVQERTMPGKIPFAFGPEPNPGGSPARIRLSLPEAATTRITIYDVSGKLVAEPFRGLLPRGYHDVTWDGRDRAGRAVANGIYLLKFDSEKYNVARKLVLQN